MKLTKHELSIGESLNRPISKHDVTRRDEWMAKYTDDLFRLAKIGIEAESKIEKVTHTNTP